MTSALEPPTIKIASRSQVSRGPIKLKPTQVHKTKKTYNRKKTKVELKSLTKTAP